MDQQIAQQIGIAFLAIALGASGWLLPYRWNLLRLRRGLRSLFPENVNQAIPKIIGSILIVVGIALLVATAVVGRFQ